MILNLISILAACDDFKFVIVPPPSRCVTSSAMNSYSIERLKCFCESMLGFYFSRKCLDHIVSIFCCNHVIILDLICGMRCLKVVLKVESFTDCFRRAAFIVFMLLKNVLISLVTMDQLCCISVERCVSGR